MQTIRPLSLMLLSCLIAACSEEPDEPVEPVEWIDVPLSDNTFFGGQREFHEGSYDILVLRDSALEFKLGMNQGDSIVYHWTVEMAEPELLTSEFHGHTNRVGDEPGTVMFYKIHTDGAEAGTLVAPFDGIHGWYLNNQSGEDITVNLRVAGFYQEL
jgi:hypothetical protein